MIKNEPSKTGVVHLWDLPLDTTYVELFIDYKYRLFETARGLAGGKWTFLARRVGIIFSDYTPELIRGPRRGDMLKLAVLKKLSDFLVENGHNEFSLNILETKIESIKSKGRMSQRIRRPKFPINFNTKEGAIVISAILHDGSIDGNYAEPVYYNNYYIMRERVLNATRDLVGDIHFVQNIRNDTRISFPKIFGEILMAIGLKKGEKTVTNYRVPSFIFDLDESIIAEYVSQAIADDGNVYLDKGNNCEISIVLTVDVSKIPELMRKKIVDKNLAEYAPNILKGDKRLLERLGVVVKGPVLYKGYIRKDRRGIFFRQQWRIRVFGLKNLRILSKKIVIPIPYKQNNLLKGTVHLNHHSYILDTIGKLGSSIDKYTLGNELGLDPETARGRIRFLVGKGFVERQYYKLNNRTRVRYFLTDEGKKELRLWG